jgi:hypothetical protein
MARPIDEILVPRSQARLQIYAYSIDDDAHKGLLKVGQTVRDVKARVAEQLKTAAIKNYQIVLEEFAERDDGTTFSDHMVRAALKAKGFENHELEWMRCSLADVKTVITELRSGVKLVSTHHETFKMRPEQVEAVEKTANYFESIWKDNPDAVPRFLWNAKMRFGKTFATYQLAKRLKAERVLVMSFKPAVAEAWQTDLESHVDFDGWRFIARDSGTDPSEVEPDEPLVYFGSFQDLLGRTRPATSSHGTCGCTWSTGTW